MVTGTPCRLRENSAITDPTIAEILAHKAHSHHKRRANPYWCQAGGIRHRGQLLDPAHLCRRHRRQIDGAPVFPELPDEAAGGIAHTGGGAGDTSFDPTDMPGVIEEKTRNGI